MKEVIECITETDQHSCGSKCCFQCAGLLWLEQMALPANKQGAVVLFSAACPLLGTCWGSTLWESRPGLLRLLGNIFPLNPTDFSFNPEVSFPLQHCLQLRGTGGFWSWFNLNTESSRLSRPIKEINSFEDGNCNKDGFVWSLFSFKEIKFLL